VCESADFLAKGRELPPLERGDLIAVRGAGAYGAAMASNYNARPLAAEVLVQGSNQRVVRERQTVADTWQRELSGLAD
jgi:diaminopimelate decarboxylase